MFALASAGLDEQPHVLGSADWDQIGKTIARTMGAKGKVPAIEDVLDDADADADAQVAGREACW